MAQDKSFLDKITELESLFGQKETAKRLGISPATLRRYKTGKSPIPKAKSSKANRIYGQNKKKVIPEKVETYKKKVETKKKARKQHLLNNPKTQATVDWVQNNFEAQYIITNLLANTPEYVATLTDRTVQFMNPEDLMNNKFGVQAATVSITIFGLYTSAYESSDNEEQQHIISSRFPLLPRKKRNLEETLEFVERKFFETTKTSGKRKLNPTRFIGYKL